MARSMRVAFCGMMTALCVLLMFLTGLIPVGTYALPALAGVLLTVVVIELGTSWAWLVYAASAVLAVLIAADKEAAMLYVLFFGYYPVLKAVIERKRMRKSVAFLLKFAVFNAAMVFGYFLSIRVLGVPEDSFTVFGVYLPAVYLVLGNITFVVYDYAVTAVAMAYTGRLHRSVSHWLHLK